MTARTIGAVSAQRAAMAPEADAVAEEGLRLSNAALAARVAGTAKALLAAGVGRGDRVATLAPPSIDFWISFLAATSIGAIWQGLNPRYQRNEYAYLLEDAAPKVVFCRSPFDGRAYLEELQALAGTDVQFVTLGEAALGPAHPFLATGASVSDGALVAAEAAVQPEDVAAIVYTSGTTGKPKGAMLSHRAIVETARSNVGWIGAEALACTVCPAPINHVGALNNVCFTTFMAGGRIVFFPRVDVAALGALNFVERPSYLVASPTAFAMMLAAPGIDFAIFDFYKCIVFGGAATPAAYLEHVQKTGARLSSVYGQTETTGMFTYTLVGASLEVMSETIGQAIPGTEIRIADGETPVAPGTVGEIQVRGVCVMSGYYNKPEATAEAFTADGWLRTGDLGVVREDGNVVFSGRLKEMFKSGGYNVYPVEVELAICEHPEVAQAAVVAAPHPTFQEVGHGFIVLKAGAALDPADLKAFLKERIADYKIPKSWTVLAGFPALANGKVDKRALAACLPV